MEMSNGGFLFIIVIVLFVGIIIGGLLGTFEPIGNFGVHVKLGKAICEQEYDMDFDGYYSGELHCKPKIEQKEHYDSVIVNLEEK